MASQDLHHVILEQIAIDVAPIIADGDTVGGVIDTNGFWSIEGIFVSGSAYTDGSYTIRIQESDTGIVGDFFDIDSEDYLGDPANISLDAANQTARLGYRGKKRYVRFIITAAGVTTGATVGVIAVQGDAGVSPTPGS